MIESDKRVRRAIFNLHVEKFSLEPMFVASLFCVYFFFYFKNGITTQTPWMRIQYLQVQFAYS